jgi:hypothetical protein
MTRTLENHEILDVVDRIGAALAGPGDVDVAPLLEAVPITPENITSLTAGLVIVTAAATLKAAGVDPDTMTARIRTRHLMPLDDIAPFALHAAQLVTLACDYLMAPDGADDLASDALNRAVRHTVTGHTQDFAFLALGEIMATYRRILHGDHRGIVVA